MNLLRTSNSALCSIPAAVAARALVHPEITNSIMTEITAEIPEIIQEEQMIPEREIIWTGGVHL